MASEISLVILLHQYCDGVGQFETVGFLIIPGVALLGWP